MIWGLIGNWGEGRSDPELGFGGGECERKGMVGCGGGIGVILRFVGEEVNRAPELVQGCSGRRRDGGRHGWVSVVCVCVCLSV